MIGPGILSLIIFIVVILIINVYFKKNIAIAMFIAWIATVVVDLPNALTLLKDSLIAGVVGDVIFPAMCFTFMAILMAKTGIIFRLVEILNSIFWRIKGSSAYVSTMASALLGTITGSGSGIAAVTGAITIPWMEETGFSKQTATTIITGNVCLGPGTAPSTSMFMLIGMPIVASVISPGDVYVAVFVGGLYLAAARFLNVLWYIKANDIKPMNKEDVTPLSESLANGWPSLFMFLGVLVPLLLTTGPISDWLATTSFGPEGVKSINMMFWIPILLTVIIAIEGRKYLPKFSDIKAWFSLMRDGIDRYPTIGGTIIFSIAASTVMGDLGLGSEMTALFDVLTGFPKIVTILIVGLIILIVAGPLNATGTIAAVGAVSFGALTSIGVSPGAALSAILIFTSTEGAVPPTSGPLYVTAGISGLADPSACFKDLFFKYAIPSFVVAVLIALEIFWVPS